MECVRMNFVMAIFVITVSLILSTINAQASSPAPAPSSDGMFLSCTLDFNE
ncbi:putative arabinogalactan protein/22/41 [Helianthus annuus]|nr:putative arabinogalactan protein/22/41 [Helianthus annuus]